MTNPSQASFSTVSFPTHQHAWAVPVARHGAPHAYWEYRNRRGELVGLVLRWNLGPGSKTFLPISRIDDRWWLRAMPSPRPLYRLPELIASGNGVRSPVFVTEGERAAEAARSLGLLATTSSGGSSAQSQTDWSPLAGHNVVVLADNDEPGRKYARAVAEELVRLVPPATARILELPGLPAGGDVVEWIAEHDSQPLETLALALCRLADEVPPWTAANVGESRSDVHSASRGDANEAATGGANEAATGGAWSPVVVSLAECRPTVLEWLWPGRIPLGKLTLLIGDPGLGKSLVTLDLAARVTRGLAPPRLRDEPPAAEPAPGGVILLSAEDDVSDTICPRLLAAGADLERVRAIHAVEWRGDKGRRGHQESFSLAIHLAALEQLIESLDNCRLVVIDPLPAYMTGTDTHNNADMRGLLAPLADLAARTGVAVLGVNHLAKTAYGPTIYRSMGSLAIAASARSVLATIRDPDDPARVVVASVKSNLGAPVGGIAYRVVMPADSGLPQVHWHDEPLRLTADEMMAAAATASAAGPAIEEAARWLHELLREGPVPATRIFEVGPKLGYSVTTLRRAKNRLRVRSIREGFGIDGTYTWALPDAADRPTQATPAA